MRALMLEAGRLSLSDLPAPTLGNDEVLLRVTYTGICGTDLALMRGYAGFRGVPGHEFVGRICDAGRTSLREGQRVVCEINVGCGRREACSRGCKTHCEQRTVIGIRDRAGAFAEYVAVPAANLHVVPEAVSDEQATFVEPLAAALQIADQVDVQPGMRVLVVGAGRLGQLIARVLALHAVDVQVVARHARHRECLHGAGIATVSEADAPTRAVDLAVDASGHTSGVALALDALRPRGTLVVKSTLNDHLVLDATRLVVDELALVGSRCGAFAPALEALQTRQIDPTPLIDAVLPLEHYEAAFASARAPGALKVLLSPSAPASEVAIS